MSRATEPNKLTMNAPATATTATAIVTAWLLALANWGLDAIPETVPDAVTTSTTALVGFAIIGVAWRIGRYAQRWTYPQVADPEIQRLGAPPLPPLDGAHPVVPQIGDVPDLPPDDG